MHIKNFNQRKKERNKYEYCSSNQCNDKIYSIVNFNVRKANVYIALGKQMSQDI